MFIVAVEAVHCSLYASIWLSAAFVPVLHRFSSNSWQFRKLTAITP